MSQKLYDPNLTLRQGLAEYYQKNPGYDGEGEFLGTPRETVIGHDLVHVVFDLGSSSEEELIVEVMTAFACILPLKEIKKMPKVKFATELWKTFGPWRLIRRFVLSSPRMLRAFLKAMRMKKKWPHFNYQKYLDIPLKDIREEFGIELPV